MHQLVPQFVLENFTAGRMQGSFPAVGLFLDISGFSTMTDALMGRGQGGAELLADIMRRVLEPLIETIFRQGGFVASSAGDAVTAMFPIQLENHAEVAVRAFAAAWEIQEYMRAHQEFRSGDQSFQVSAKVGLFAGDAQWGIILAENSRRGVYYFYGPAIEGCAEAEHHAKAGDIILDEGIKAYLGALVDSEPEEAFYRINQVNGALPEKLAFSPLKTDLEGMSRFFPSSLLTHSMSGEFRQAVNMFISLPSVRTDTQLRIFMESVFSLQDKYGGLLDRLDFGDKGTNLLLFWGAPVAFENDVERALNFILDLQTITSIPISAGITYRISHAGFIGSRLFEEYTCFGRGVNLAARFMTASPRGEIWIDEFIAARIENRFDIEYAGEKTFKGFKQPQKVYILFERKEEDTTIFEGIHAGREDDLRQLRTFTSSIFEGQSAGVLVICGEPGIGKSRLVYEHLQSLQEQERRAFQVFLGQTDEIVRESLNPFRYWLRQYFAITESLGESRGKRIFNRKIDDLIASTEDETLARELDRTRSFLGAAIGLHWPDSLYEQLDAQGRYKNTFIALIALLQAESLQQPVIMLLEDIHWLDEDSRALLSQLMRSLNSQAEKAYPIAVLCTSRDDIDTLALNDLTCCELRLRGLARDGLRSLATDILGAPPARDLLDLLEQRADGNPFYAGQIVHYLKEENLLISSPGGWHLQPGQSNAIPVDVNVLLVARLDHLNERVKEVVQTASILGREFEVTLLGQMLRDTLSTTGKAVPAEVIEAERQEIWSALSEIRYIFKHTLLRDAAYQMQVLARRKQLHELACDAYEKLYASSLEDHYGELAYHAEQAGLAEKACRYFHLAGIQAADDYQNAQATEYLNRALVLTPESDLEQRFDRTRELIALYRRLGNNTDHLRCLEILEELGRQMNDPHRSVEVLSLKAEYALDISDHEAVDTLIDRAMTLVQGQGMDETLLVLYNTKTTSLYRQGMLNEAAEFAEQGLKWAQSLDLVNEARWELNTLGLIAIEQGRLDMAQNYFNQSLEAAIRIGALRHQIAPLNNMGKVASAQWRFSEAEAYYQQSLEISRKTGDRSSEAIALGNLGFIANSLGEYQKSQSYLNRTIQIARETGNAYILTYNLINLAACLVAMGDYHSAVQHCNEAQAIARKGNDRSGEAWALTYMGHCFYNQGLIPEAEEAYQQAVAIREGLSQPELRSEPAAGLARSAMQRGDIASALAEVQPVVAYLFSGGTLEGTDEPLRVYLTCYHVLAKTGDPRAAELLKTAHETLENQAAKILDDTARQAFCNITYHKEIHTLWEHQASA